MPPKDGDASQNPAIDSSATHKLAVLGAGVMGTGIAALATGYGVPVVLIDVDAVKLTRAGSQVAYHLRAAALHGALPENAARGELTISATMEAASDATAVIEAVTEQPDVKVKVLAQAQAALASGVPLISNTSSIPVGELARGIDDPPMLIGVHFMNPPYLISAVEVSRGPDTSDSTARQVLSLLAALDREPVIVGDTPGFVTSRLLHPMINDAARIVAAGIATAPDVDALLHGCLGHPTGPLRTADLIGIDNLVDSLNVLYQRTGSEACRPCDLLLDKVRAGELGRKTGKGFYAYGEATV